MIQHLVVLAVFVPMILGVVGAAAAAGSNTITTETIAAEIGLPFQTHTVTTVDGYILTLHRVPNPGRKPVFIMPGLLASSSDFFALKERSLVNHLYKAGFDVWVGNGRGNSYSQQHVSLNPDVDHKFWDFSWHEIGVFDVPAMIRYVCEQTGGQKIIYIGQTQGTTTFLVAGSLVTGFNQFIESAQFLSPIAYLNHASSPALNAAAQQMGDPTIEPPWDVIGRYEFKPTHEFMESMASTMCNMELSNSILCYNPLFLFCGFNEKTVDPTILKTVMATSPSTGSTRQALHYLQETLSGKFRQFDYGEAGNWMKYGQSEPPNYPIGNISVPIVMYLIEHDTLAAREDVQRLIGELNTPVIVFRIPGVDFDHMSQLFSAEAPILLYNTLIANILPKSVDVPKPNNNLLNNVFRTVTEFF